MRSTTPRKSLSSSLEHLLLVIVLMALAGLCLHFKLLWRWDNLLYDSQLSLWQRTVSENIIIIAIDDESLQQIGRWPWSRSVHAELLRAINKQSPAAIGLDIIFSEPDIQHPQADQALAEAIRDSGKVILPVYMTQQSSNAVPIEALPLPKLTRYAARLGHVHIDTSTDGIARRVFLREGIGQPQWLHYSLALLEVAGSAAPARFDAQPPANSNYSAMQWSREQPYLIPYAGASGHFPSIGYAQVLAGQYPKDLFRNKIVLIGSTAEGMGDTLPTPVSGKQGNMPGVEIIANVVDAMQQGLSLHQLDAMALLITTLLLVALPMLVYPYLNPGYALLFLFASLLLSLSLAGIMLWGVGLWLPLSTILLFQFVSYPLWSWRRLVLAMRHLNLELDLLLNQQSELNLNDERNLVVELEFLSGFIPIIGWVLQDERGHRILHNGKVPLKTGNPEQAGQWLVENDQHWASILYQNQRCVLGLRLQSGSQIDEAQQCLLDHLIDSPLKKSMQPHYLGDVLQKRITRVQKLGTEYISLRRIIDDSLSAMADGVLIVNSHGQLMLSNKRASWYLCANDNATLNGRSLLKALDELQSDKQGGWNTLIQQVLLQQQRVNVQARHTNGRDLMVEISPLHINREALPGLVVNLSDISQLKQSERERSEVLNFLSHDLRSPLSSMIAMIELASNKRELGEVQDMLQSMEKNTYKTLHLAEQFLQLSRANSAQKLEFREVDFNSLVLNAIDQMWALSSKLQVSIEQHFAEDEVWTYVEPDLLERAVVNLLSNALKHSQPQQAVSITVRLTQQVIECCVQDSGSGIAAEELPQLFEMFRRTRGSGVERKHGVGLGLAFVDAVARRHSGRIDVSSTLGKGSCFCLKIPLLLQQ